jgi:hypothetical protein
MRAQVVVVVTPSAERLARMGEVIEDLFIKEFVAQAPVKAFNEGVLRRFAGRDVMPANAVFVLPFKHRAAGEFCPIIADDRCGLAIEADEGIEFASDPQTRDRCVGDQAEAFACEVIDNREDAEPAASAKYIGEKVEAPALKGASGERHWTFAFRSRVCGPAGASLQDLLPGRAA